MNEVLALAPFEWLSYSFMRNALLAVTLVSVILGIIGTMSVNNRMAFFSDALGHSALTGIALGVVLGISNQAVALLVFGVVWAVLINRVKFSKVASTDTVIAVFSSTAIALGLVILSRGGGFAKFSNFLVGDVLSVSATDVYYLLIVLVAVVAVWLLIFNKLLLTSIDQSLCASRGVNTRLVDYIFIILLAVVVMLSIQWVGILLINSFLILPAAAARNIAKNVRAYTLLSVLFALFCGLGGLIASFYLNTSAGAAIILFSAAVYFVTLVLRKK